MADNLSGKLVYHNNSCNTLLSNLLTTKTLCDVTIIVGDKSFEAHRCILAATIPFFSAMFTSNLDDSSSDTVRIKSEDVDPDTFKLIIDYVYSQEITIDSWNVDLILISANFLGIESLLIVCCDYLRRHLDVETVTKAKYLGEMVNCADLVYTANRYIINNLPDVSQSPHFYDLPKESLSELIEIVSSDVRKQVTILKAVLQWINYDFESRKCHLPSFLNQMSIFFVKPEVLVASVLDNRYMFNSIETLGTIFDALAFQLLPHRRSDPAFEKFDCPNFPLNESKNKAMYIIDNEAIMETLHSNQSDSWKSMRMTSHRVMAACATLYNELYLIGGLEISRITPTVEKYDHNGETLAQCQPLHIARYNAAACVYNGKIYVIGGSTLKHTTTGTTEIYDPIQDKWVVSSSMELSRCCHAVVQVKGRLYALGGAHQEYSKVISNIEILDPDNGTWKSVGELSQPRMSFGSIAYNNLIYLFGGVNGSTALDTVEVYDPCKNFCTPLPSMSCKRVSPLVLYFKSKIYVIGGSEGGISLKTTEIFDPITLEWSEGPELQRPAARTIGGVLNTLE